jgi:hypothetical protein
MSGALAAEGEKEMRLSAPSPAAREGRRWPTAAVLKRTPMRSIGYGGGVAAQLLFEFA